MWPELFFAAVALLFVIVHGYTMRKDRALWRNRYRPCNILSIRIRYSERKTM